MSAAVCIPNGALRPLRILSQSGADDDLATLGKLHRVPNQVEMHLPQAIDADWKEARCLGWFGQRRGERVSIGHGGSIHGFITRILFHKASRTGVVAP